MKHRVCAVVLLAIAGSVTAAAAQDEPDPQQAQRDSLALIRQQAFLRANWFSDRVPVGIGDLLTVVVDEQTAARERVSKVATGDRDLRGTLRADTDGTVQSYGVSTGLDKSSRDVGEAGRVGDLTAVLTVRVVGVEGGGVLRIEGQRSVNVDGRQQEITLTGLVRAEDVGKRNLVSSQRIADAVITYKGKKIGPRTGILGSILGLLWP